MYGITRKTLFYYDRNGLLKPTDRVGSQEHKVYDARALERLAKILEYKSCGLKIAEIRNLFSDPSGMKQILEQALQRIEAQRMEAEVYAAKLRKMLEKL